MFVVVVSSPFRLFLFLPHDHCSVAPSGLSFPSTSAVVGGVFLMVLFLRLCFWLFGGVFIGVVSFVVHWWNIRSLDF